MMMQAVIIHGPQGCGKTRHAKDFCELYGCTAWTDDWLPGEPLTPGLLHLTFEVPSGLPGCDVQIISFDEAMKALGEKIVVRHLGTTTWQGPANQAPEFLGAQPGHNIAPVVSPTQMERLTFLIEECREVIKEATKIVRFGFDSYHPADPTQETNRDRLFREMRDVRASYDILVDAGDGDPMNLILIDMSGRKWKVVATSNFADKTYAEKEIIGPWLSEMGADAICEILNRECVENDRTFYTPKTADYKLWRGVEELI